MQEDDVARGVDRTMSILLNAAGIQAGAIIYRHVVVDHMGQPFGQICQLVVVGSEEGAGAQFWMVVDVLDDGPGDGETVVGAGATADLVEHQQAAVGGVVEDVGRFDHLHHKGRLPAVDLIRCADAGEDAVDDADLRRFCRHKAANLGHERDQSRLAEEGALARHVRPCQHVNAGVGRKVGIVGHKRVIHLRQFDHRVTPTADFDAGAFVEWGRT